MAAPRIDRGRVFPAVVAVISVLALAALSGCSAATALTPTLPASRDAVRADTAAPAPLASAPAPAPLPEESKNRSYVVPAVEIVAMDTLVNLAARQVMNDPEDFRVTPGSIGRNFRSRWVVDDDPFQVNQFLHPYQGAMYHGFARASGLNFWKSWIYTFAGSALWEIAGETTPPSKNDQIASGVAGAFLGESLFRMAGLVLAPPSGSPGMWRVLGATVLSPPAGLNHMLFGDRFESQTANQIPASDVRIQLGTSNRVSTSGPSFSLNRRLAGFSMDYGFPGESTYAHRRPFDYFSIDALASSDRGIESVTTRGLIAGRDFQMADAGHGVWGVYGLYDYFKPDDFLFSTTAFAVGGSAQARLSKSMAFQGTTLAGLGYAAAQTANGAGNQDYHYGLAPELLLSTRLIAGRRASLDLSARQYFVTDVASFTVGEHDRVFRGDTALTVRVAGRQAVAVTYGVARRHASIPGVLDVTQSTARVGLFYTLLGLGGFGAFRQ